MKDFPVDIVYTWVDGNDPEWIEKKQKTLSNYSEFHQTKEVSGEARFTAREELKYSLRSIEKYAPWVRKIFIVTDNQTPSWLDTDNNKIEIVDHKDIFDKQYLPSYNSNAIESCIHKVPDLSNNFLSMNDDLFIGRPSKISENLV